MFKYVGWVVVERFAGGRLNVISTVFSTRASAREWVRNVFTPKERNKLHLTIMGIHHYER